ncbi:putative nucleoredoxin 1 [Apium graveolens]|uniref:putative nucleoredoxin 1 n=1 Tax=Apium graveolens TaxID=4045 RepID=UPI003D7AB1A8
MWRNHLRNGMKTYVAYSSSHVCNVSSRTYYDATKINSYKQAYTWVQFPEQRGQLLEEHKVIRKGDIINLHDLLFTKYRDYVVRHTDDIDVQVKAAQLAGKVIVLYFLPLHHDYAYSRMSVSYLTDTYTYLLSDNVFEVVLVAYGSAEDILSSDSYKDSQSHFESIFYHMPWTAIPFPDFTSRDHLARRFGIDRLRCYSTSIVIDSSGLVLQSNSCKLFEKYGGIAYPFSNERIEFLETEDANAERLSLTALLGSPKRDYVISNKGDKVVIKSLEEKVVALYFYEKGITPDWLTASIKTAYEEFAQKKSCFEVVLVYLHCTSGTIDNTSKESFSNTFETMPWLAIPFRDPICKRMMRVFGRPYYGYPSVKAPSLVIIGPHGEFIEPWGADIICKFKLPAYPFTRQRVAKLDTEIVRELTLDMLLDANTTLRRKDGSKVRLSQIFGKRIILFFEGDDCRNMIASDFLNKLKERYLDMKGTSDEFEVIYITNIKKEFPFNKPNKDVPSWFLSFASDLLPIDLSLYCCYCHLLLVPGDFACWCGGGFGKWRRKSSMLAFDHDGRIVRKSINLSFEDTDFPFSAGSMEDEAFSELRNVFLWRDE